MSHTPEDHSWRDPGPWPPIAPPSDIDWLRARVAELEAENADLKRKLAPAKCWDDDPVIGPMLQMFHD